MMNADRIGLSRQLTLFLVMTIVGFSLRFLPYWKEQYDGWLLCIWGANAVLPLLMLTVSQSKSISWGYAIPFLGFVVSDLIIQVILQARNLPTSSLSGRLAIYAIFLVLSQLGLILRVLKLQKIERVIVGVSLTLLGSVLFFIISNFMVWYASTPADGNYYYPPTWAGLLRCYEMALPFFKNQFFGDGLFSLAFFSIYGLLEQRVLASTVDRKPLAA